MYVENGKISSRQTFRLYVFDLLGMGTLLLPPYLAQLCGMDGVFAIILGTLAGWGYLLYLGWIMKHMKTDLCSYLKAGTNRWIRNCVYGWVFLHSVLTAGFCGYVFANLMQYSLVQETSYALILFVIVLVSAYAVSGGIEVRARVYEVLFWFVLIPYTVMMLASLKDFELEYVDEFFQTGMMDFGKGIYLVFLLLTPLFFSLFLIGEKEKNYGRTMIKTVTGSLLLSSGILLFSYVLLMGNFGGGALGNMRFPVVTLMSTIQFKGNFLKRMDALMLAVWFFTLFALLNLHLHYGAEMLQEICNDKKLKWQQVLIPAGAVFAAGYAMHRSEGWLRIFLDYYSYIAVPIMVIGPLLLLWIGSRKEADGEGQT